MIEKEYSELEGKFNKLLTERKIEELSNEKKKEIRRKSEKAARKIDLNEAETRQLIDDQLKQAGWEADTINLNFKTKGTLPDKRESMAIAEWPTKNGWADYALFIGKDLYGFAEEKKYALDISSDLTQSKRYAETVEEKNEAKLIGKWRNYKVPFLFATNGRPYLEQIKTKSGIWFLDVRKETNQSKPLQGWYSPEGLKKLFQQDIEEAIEKLKSDDIDYLADESGLNLRDYQIKAINPT